VKRILFSPAPKVDSAILLIKDISRKRFRDRDHERTFFELLHAGMGTKRKTLINNLERELGVTKIDLAEIFSACALDARVRAERLTLTEWLDLCDRLAQRKSID
jgi:16S rRNA (adenine1518-N6/adenine1519-N6)-dimethyltransferase